MYATSPPHRAYGIRKQDYFIAASNRAIEMMVIGLLDRVDHDHELLRSPWTFEGHKETARCFKRRSRGRQAHRRPNTGKE